jgi:Icc protein
MLIAHVSDFHVVGRGLRLKDRFDTRAALERLAKRLQTLTPRPDLLVVSGDLGEDATADEYNHVSGLLRPLGLPILAVPGNHDLRAPLVEALPDVFLATRDGFLCRTIEVGTHAFIALDTIVEGAAHGALCAKRLGWLDRALSETTGRRRVIVIHHPPIETGMTSMDAIGINEGKAEFAELIRGHGGIDLILCGHVHRSIQGSFAGVPVRVAPSSSHQFACDLTPGAPYRFTAEPAQFMLHVLGPSPEPVTHTLYVEEIH